MEDAANPPSPARKARGAAKPDTKAQSVRSARRKAAIKAKRAAAQKSSKPVVIRPLATPARAKRRHWGLLSAFAVMVLLPIAAAIWYLNERAIDQYASTIGFTVRSEDAASAADLLGGLGATLGGGGGSDDADILYEFIRSQAMVAAIDAELDLRSLYSRHVDDDPLFGFDPDGTIEDLTEYWQRMVRISYDAGSGLMELRVLAFAPDEAQRIAEAIFAESTAMINDLSAIAREDATRYARQDLDLSIERLKEAREALTAFRIATQIVDPEADVQGQVGLVNTLQAQLAEALIELDVLSGSTREGDPRIDQAQSRVDVIEARIAEERRKFGTGGLEEGDESYATTIAEFERLAVDREFAEQSYAASLGAFDVALADANRQSRYLAAYIRPTLAERAEFPQRPLIVALVALFAFLTWAITALVYYALRDRR